MSEYEKAKARNADTVDKKFFTSRFTHLQSHNGFRPGELHTFIAEKGGGKSTLVRAWIVDCLLQGKKVLLRLSEDRTQTYRDSLILYLREGGVKYLDNLIIDSEIELPTNQLGGNYINALRAKIIKTSADIFILDNFTTSVLSRSRPAEQEQYAVTLRQIAMDSEIPVIVVAHTEKGFNKKRGIATGDNIRGNMTLSNTAAYVYTLTIFHELSDKPTFLFIDKARHHSNANKKLFKLNFKDNTYEDDKPATFDLLKLTLKDVQR
jgi:hypothetical protein